MGRAGRHHPCRARCPVTRRGQRTVSGSGQASRRGCDAQPPVARHRGQVRAIGATPGQRDGQGARRGFHARPACERGAAFHERRQHRWPRNCRTGGQAHAIRRGRRARCAQCECLHATRAGDKAHRVDRGPGNGYIARHCQRRVQCRPRAFALRHLHDRARARARFDRQWAAAPRYAERNRPRHRGTGAWNVRPHECPLRCPRLLARCRLTARTPAVHRNE